MAEVMYYVALPFIASDDGVVAGEPTECFNPNAAVMRAEVLSKERRTRRRGRVQPHRRSRYRRFQRRQGDQEIRRRAR
jgi:hypothetical protein